MDYIPTFLLMEQSGYDGNELVRFLKIMESEIKKGSSFDMKYFKECRLHLSTWIEPISGSPEEEVEVFREWLSKLDDLENENIINSHKNKSRLCTSYLKRHTVNFMTNR